MGKGRLVSVTGRLQTRSWDGQDGKKQYATEVVADAIEFMDKAPDGQQNQQSNDGFDFGSGGGGGFQPVDNENQNLPF